MSRFFIERPIFAWVVAILIMLAGAVSLLQLPISQYPDVAPPAVAIDGMYPGASAQTVQDSVVQTIEQQLNGLDGFIYMSSTSQSDGRFSIIVTFKQGTDPDIAQVQVQNKLSLATPLLPAEVQAQGMSVAKHQANFFLIPTFYCDDGSLTEKDLGDLMTSQVKDVVGRTDGVGAVQVFGSQYSMRIWLKPDKLRAFFLTPQDVVSAIQGQNVQVTAGQLGGQPAPEGSRIAATVVVKNRMTSVDQFRNILVRTDENGAQIRLRDVADVELGSEVYNYASKVNGCDGVGMAIRLATGANILDTTDRVKAAIEDLLPFMPKGVKVAYVNETAPVVRASIEAVVHTLVEAIVLVFGVMFLFLQRWRVTLVPMLTIPVVLLGTFIVILVGGFSMNVIILFALTLAIGLLVDDAIVVVENVERLMSTEGLDAKAATIKTMEQIQGALVGVGATIAAVFLPTAFFGGSTGVIYRQFSVTIITSMLLSVFVALTFAPALCATMLRDKPGKKRRRPLFFFRWFNGIFELGTKGYAGSVQHIVYRRKRFMIVFLLFVGALVHLYPKMPTAFLPTEDQGTLFAQVELPPNASQERTNEILGRVVRYFYEEEKEAVANVLEVSGFSFSGANQNSGIAFVAFRPFEERTKPGLDIFSVMARANAKFAETNEAKITVIVPPSIMELGTVSGLDFYLQDQAGLGHDKMVEIQNQFLGAANSCGKFVAAWPNSLPDEPQYKIDIDDEKVRAMKTNLADVNSVLSIAWGSMYVNDFIDRGRVKRVYVQGEPASRASVSDLEKWHVRNSEGRMTPFSAFATGHWISGPPKLARYNGVSGIQFNAMTAPGVSSGDAMLEVERLVKDLPQGVGLSYTGLSYEERQAGSQSLVLYSLALVVVFLCLAALYESWSTPFAVAMVVPFGALGAVAAVLMRDMQNDVFFQVGLLTVMGLSAKNAILIVEFAKDAVEKEGVPILKAVVTAARLRLRPIIMTSAAFGLGVLPMTKAEGASSISQQSLGTSVLGGTIAATFLAIFFVPLFYVFVCGLFNPKLLKQKETRKPETEAKAS